MMDGGLTQVLMIYVMIHTCVSFLVVSFFFSFSFFFFNTARDLSLAY